MKKKGGEKTVFKFNKNYKDLEQVRAFFEDFKREYNKIKAKGEYPYNSCFEGKIKGIEGGNEKTAIYLLQKLQDKEEKEKLEKKMLADGWQKLTEDIIEEARKNKKKILLSAKSSNDWATFKVNKLLKPHFFGGSIQKWGLMELRAKTRGYGLYQFEDAFCKLV